MRKLITYLLIAAMVIILAPGIVQGIVREPEPPQRYTLHTVVKGETLWQIAGRYMPDTDQRLGIHWIKKANGLTNSYVIQPGDELNIPDEDGPLAEPYGQD